MDVFPLGIFPQWALSNSIITTVWVGVAIVALTNMRFGWVLSGLVVPGYIVPLLFAKPLAACVIFAEAILVYGLVYGLNHALGKYAQWSHFFGRDRFFALVLASVLVRLILDGYLLPELGLYLINHWQFSLDYQTNLHSFGLILVSLMANQFWKPGLIRGLAHSLFQLAATYLIVRLVLMNLTNFSITNLSYVYEDIAVSVLASPKSYIILITAAFIASRLNLRYGWDFGGIMIPSLLALQMYQPMKIVMTIFEAGLIYVVADRLLRIPFFANREIAGARKIVFFFNVSFLYKLLLGHAFVLLELPVKTTDYYAFGYLLATLLAVKMHDKRIALKSIYRVLNGAVRGGVIASVIGFLLVFLPSWSSIPDVPDVPAESPISEYSLNDAISRMDTGYYLRSTKEGGIKPTQIQRDKALWAAQALHQFVEDKGYSKYQSARAVLISLGYEVFHTKEGYIAVLDRKGRDWGSFIINPGAENRLIIQIPEVPVSSILPRVMADVFEKQNALIFAVKPAYSPDKNRLIKPGKGEGMSSIFNQMMRVFQNQNLLQVWAVSDEEAHNITGSSNNSLWIKNTIPKAMNLVRLQEGFPVLETNWTPPPFISPQYQDSRRGVASLVLTDSAIRAYLRANIDDSRYLQQTNTNLSMDALVSQWLSEGKLQIIGAGTDQYVPPTTSELHFINDRVISPLLESLDEYWFGQFSKAGKDLVVSAAYSAQAIGLSVHKVFVQSTGQSYLVISDTHARKGWGTLIISLDARGHQLVEIARPLMDQGAIQGGLDLFARLDASFLLIAGAHPKANLSGNAQVDSYAYPQSLFNLFHGTLVMNSPLPDVFSVRTMHSVITSVDVDGVFHSFSEELSMKDAARNTGRLFDLIGLNMVSAQGLQQDASHEVGTSPQLQALAASDKGQFTVVWLSKSRGRKMTPEQAGRYLRDMKALQIKTRIHDFSNQFKKLSLRSDPRLDKRYVDDVNQYLDTGDIVALARVRDRFPSNALQYWTAVPDQAGVLVVMNKGHLAAVSYFDANLKPCITELNKHSMERLYSNLQRESLGACTHYIVGGRR